MECLSSMAAAVGGHVNVTQYIVFRAGPNIVLFKDKEGRQAVDIAQEEPKTFLQQVSQPVSRSLLQVERTAAIKISW